MDRIEKAGKFIAAQGRDIDRALFAYHFGSASQEELLEALGRYQNPDGGFGNGLEPDITAPASNAFATSLALKLMVEAGVPGSHAMVARTVRYLEGTQNDEGCWPFSPAVYEHELAPWFQGWEWPSLNPECVIAGHLSVLGVGSAQLHGRVAALFDRMATPDDLVGDQYYALQPYAFYFVGGADHPRRDLYQSGVAWWLIRQHLAGTLPDAGHFFEYVGEPDSAVARLIPPGILEAQLERLEGEMEEDGGWPSPYAPHWRAFGTVQALQTLRRFGRLPGSEDDRLSALLAGAEMTNGEGGTA
jgi:hypothetical protein